MTTDSDEDTADKIFHQFQQAFLNFMGVACTNTFIDPGTVLKVATYNLALICFGSSTDMDKQEESIIKQVKMARETAEQMQETP